MESFLFSDLDFQSAAFNLTDLVYPNLLFHMNQHPKIRYQSLNAAAIRGAACVLAFSFCSFAEAATQVLARAQGTAGPGGHFQQNSAPGGSVTAMGANGANGYTTAASATARFGVLNAFSEAHAPLNQFSVNSGAIVSFTDDYLFNAPGRTGQAGTFNFTLSIDGSLSATFDAVGLEDPLDSTSASYAQAALAVFQDGGGITGGGSERLYSNGDIARTGALFLNRTNSFAVPFTFGTPFELKVQLSTLTNARGQFSADTIADLGHTLEWGGIVSVLDNGSLPVNNYTLSSGSGTDYSQSIPEPSTTLLFMVSGFALSLVRTRQRPSASA